MNENYLRTLIQKMSSESNEELNAALHDVYVNGKDKREAADDHLTTKHQLEQYISELTKPKELDEPYLRALAAKFTKNKNEQVLNAAIEHILLKTPQRKLEVKYGVAQSTIGKFKKSLMEQHEKFNFVMQFK